MKATAQKAEAAIYCENCGGDIPAGAFYVKRTYPVHGVVKGVYYRTTHAAFNYCVDCAPLCLSCKERPATIEHRGKCIACDSH